MINPREGDGGKYSNPINRVKTEGKTMKMCTGWIGHVLAGLDIRTLEKIRIVV